MPRYLVHRTWDELDPDHMARVVGRMMALARRYDDVVWLHSHPAVDAEGRLTTHCVYDAPDEATVRMHGLATGHHVVDEVTEIIAELSPAGSDVAPGSA